MWIRDREWKESGTVGAGGVGEGVSNGKGRKCGIGGEALCVFSFIQWKIIQKSQGGVQVLLEQKCFAVRFSMLYNGMHACHNTYYTQERLKTVHESTHAWMPWIRCNPGWSMDTLYFSRKE
jgi:hypothetical protein